MSLIKLYEMCCSNTINSNSYNIYKTQIITDARKIYNRIVNKHDLHTQLLNSSKKGLTSLILYEGDDDIEVIKKVKEYFENYFNNSGFILSIHEKSFTEKNLIQVVMADNIYYIMIKWNITPQKQDKACTANLDNTNVTSEINEYPPNTTLPTLKPPSSYLEDYEPPNLDNNPNIELSNFNKKDYDIL